MVADHPSMHAPAYLGTEGQRLMPFCSQISCTYCSLEANERIASSLCLLRTHFIIPYSRGGTQCVMVRVSTVQILAWMSGSRYG